MTPEQIQPMPGWVLCRALSPRAESAGGITLAKDFDKDTVSEGVAEVLHVGPPAYVGKKAKTPTELGVTKGDKVLYRGFLRHAQPCGTLLGGPKPSSFFLLNYRDILAVLEGNGSAGFYDEFHL